MSEILKDFSVLALINAMETNIQELSICWGRLIEATFHEDAESAWLLSGLPFELCNGVIRTHVPPENQGGATEKLIQRFMAHQMPMTWLICPSTQPTDLGQRLLAHGWSIEDTPGMALDLLTLDEHVSLTNGLSIECVSDDKMLRQWIRTMIAGSAMPESVRDFTLNLHAKHSFISTPSVHFYLGSFKGKPVATSLLFLSGGVAGIYNVATLPEARGRGYGTVLTVAPLLDARKMGYRIGILQSSAMGRNVYRRLGFQPYGIFAMCMWSASEEFMPHTPPASTDPRIPG
jgi:GNAT superfamily N-acetyltransferase